MEQVKGLERGLEVLNGLVELESGTVREVASHTGLTQQATYRYLESLRRKGFAYRKNYREPYRATTRAFILGGQISTDVAISDCAQPVLDDLARQLEWPVSLTAVMNKEATVLASAEYRSHKDLKDFVKSGPLPRFGRPSWALYLALIPPDKAREQYLKDLENHGSQLLVRDPDFYDVLLSRIRSSGHVIYNAFRSPQGSAAVPIHDVEGRLYAIEVRFIEAEIARADVENRLIPAMKSAAGTIRSAADPLLAALSAIKVLNL